MSTEQDYIFTADWFSQNIPIWNQVLSQFKNQPINVLEIGSYEGKSATWLLDNILTHPNAKLFCCDPFSGSVEHNSQNMNIYDIFINNIKSHIPKVTICRGYSYDLLKSTLLKNNRFDFIYIDGDHHPYSALEDAVLCFRILKYGGIMIFDDYEWKGYSELHTPKFGVDGFILGYKNLIDIIHIGYQYIIRKKLPKELNSVDYLTYIYSTLQDCNETDNVEQYKDTKIELTSALFNIGSYQDSIKHCNDLINKYPTFYKAFKNKAVCQYRLGDINGAIDTAKNGGDNSELLEILNTLLDIKQKDNIVSDDEDKLLEKLTAHLSIN